MARLGRREWGNTISENVTKIVQLNVSDILMPNAITLRKEEDARGRVQKHILIEVV